MSDEEKQIPGLRTEPAGLPKPLGIQRNLGKVVGRPGRRQRWRWSLMRGTALKATSTAATCGSAAGLPDEDESVTAFTMDLLDEFSGVAHRVY